MIGFLKDKLGEKLNNLLMVKTEDDTTSVNAWLKAIESGKFYDKVVYGVGEGEKGFLIVDPLKSPGSLYCGAMGAGKSEAMKFSLVTRILSNSEHDFFILVDILKGMTDYVTLFDLKENVVTALNNPAKLIPVIDMVHAEMVARKDEFSRVGANNLYKYEEIMKQQGKPVKLARIFLCMEEFSAIPNSEYIKFGYKVDQEGTAANQLKELSRAARSFGIFLFLSTQRATPEDIPSTLKPGINNMFAFRMINFGDAAAMNLPTCVDIPSNLRGRCAYENGFMQYPYILDNAIKVLLKKYYKPLTAKMLKYSVQDFHTALEGEGNEGMVRVKPYKSILVKISEFNPLDVFTRYLEAFNFKVEKQTNKALGVQLIAERDNKRYAVYAASGRGSISEKTTATFKDGAKILGCDNAIVISSESLSASMLNSSLKSAFKEILVVDGEELTQAAEVLDSRIKLEEKGIFDQLFNKLTLARKPQVAPKADTSQEEDESQAEDDDELSVEERESLTQKLRDRGFK